MSEAKQAARHVTKFNFGDSVWHRVTGDEGMVFCIILRENSQPRYGVIFQDELSEYECLETELLDEPKTAAK